MDLYAELRALVSALDRGGVPYALCGGLALAVYGAPRATQDIDLLVPPEAIDPLRQAARACGFTFESPPFVFAGNGVTIKRFTKLVDGQPLMLDALIAEGALAPIFRDRLTSSFEEGVLQVVSRDGLIALKLAAGRPQDLVDIQRLEELARG